MNLIVKPDRASGLTLIVLALALAAFVVANQRVGTLKRDAINPEFSVRLPVPAQIVMAVGDRHLAADLAEFRVLVADTFRMRPEDYALQAGLQRDIAFLNPAHEDNYYIAAAILPWGGQLDAAQYVLKQAAKARPMDYQPLFYYGFNLFHFQQNPVEGAAALLRAVGHTHDVQDQMALQNTAALWMERGYSLAEAATRVAAMAKASPPGGFRKSLEVRANRVRTLDDLRVLARTYERLNGRPLREIGDLVRSGLLETVPKDPLRVGFAVDANGEPVFANALRKAGQ